MKLHLYKYYFTYIIILKLKAVNYSSKSIGTTREKRMEKEELPLCITPPDKKKSNPKTENKNQTKKAAHIKTIRWNQKQNVDDEDALIEL